MQLKKTLITTIVISIIGIIAWEAYWRSQGLYPNLDDNKELWSVERNKLKTASENDVVFIGSSRVLFDIQKDDWENETGLRPIQLASAGSSPLPIFKDIVENTDYTGTIIVGVTPGLFFSTTYPGAMPWKRAQTKVDYFQKRTYAQQLNHWLSVPLQQNLVLMSANEEEWSDDIDLKSLINKLKKGGRTEKPLFPPFYNFADVKLDRNIVMTTKTASDTTFANTIKKVWKAILTSEDLPPPDKESTTTFFLEYAKKFKDKGGNLILLRCPSSGMFKGGESQFLARAEFWEELLTKSNAKGYHYEDYDQFKNLDCPEWSHLSATDAKYFTTTLAKIMIKDNVITNL